VIFTCLFVQSFLSLCSLLYIIYIILNVLFTHLPNITLPMTVDTFIYLYNSFTILYLLTYASMCVYERDREIDKQTHTERQKDYSYSWMLEKNVGGYFRFTLWILLTKLKFPSICNNFLPNKPSCLLFSTCIFGMESKSFVCLFVCFVFLYSPGCPGAHFVDQAGLKLRNPPVSVSQILGLKVCATTARLESKS
jgi:hypothetical protein